MRAHSPLWRVSSRSGPLAATDTFTLIEPDRFLVALPGGGYDEAVLFAERTVDDVRALAIPSSVTKPVVGPRLSVTAAVVSVESRADIERFWPRVNDLLRDGKSTGGDAIVRDR